MSFINSNLCTLGRYLEKLDEFFSAQSKVIASLVADDSALEISKKREALKIDHIMRDGRELIAESLEGADRVREIVRNLKDFSRPDKEESEHADINECISGAINIVWNQLKYKANLTSELGDIPLIKCYPQQLGQVFMNLLVNASQAIEKQGEIGVRTWYENGKLLVQITDTGCGIPGENLHRIFEPFFTTKDVGKGTGLGLSVTYEIIKNHNGEIIVESEPGKGSTFTVQLPVVMWK